MAHPRCCPRRLHPVHDAPHLHSKWFREPRSPPRGDAHKVATHRFAQLQKLFGWLKRSNYSGSLLQRVPQECASITSVLESEARDPRRANKLLRQIETLLTEVRSAMEDLARMRSKERRNKRGSELNGAPRKLRHSLPRAYEEDESDGWQRGQHERSQHAANEAAPPVTTDPDLVAHWAR